MSESIVIPSSFDELPNSSITSKFYVNDAYDAATLSNSEIRNRIEALSALTTGDTTLIENMNQMSIDDMFSLISYYDKLSNDNKTLFSDMLLDMSKLSISFIKNSSDSIIDNTKLKNSIIIVLYMSLALFNKVETIICNETRPAGTTVAVASSNNNNEEDEEDDDKPKKAAVATTTAKVTSSKLLLSWCDIRDQYVSLLNDIVSIDQSVIWSMGIVPEPFLSFIWSVALKLIESNTSNVTDRMKKTLVDIVSSSIKLFASSSGSLCALSTSLIGSIMRCEQVSTYAAAIITKPHCKLLRNEIILEISHIASGANGIKNVGSFIEALAISSPVIMTSFMPTMKHLVDSKSHQIRSSLLRAMGTVIVYIHSACQGKLEPALSAVSTDENSSSDFIEEEGEANISQLVRVRDSLIDLLVERTHDTSYYTRSAVLKVWQSLVETHSLPLSVIAAVADVAIDRLNDKTVSVRKNAIALLTSLIDNNPFSGSLDSSSFEVTAKELQALRSQRIEDLRVSHVPLDAHVEAEEEEEEEEEEGTTKAAKEDAFLESHDVKDDAQMNDIDARIDHCSKTLHLTNTLSTIVSTMESLLHSTTSSDVISALKFLTTAVTFNIKGSASAMTNAFTLVWHADAAIVSETIASFYRVYVTDGSDEGTALAPIDIVMNMINITNRCSNKSTTDASLEKIMYELVKSSMIDPLTLAPVIWRLLDQHSANGNSDRGAVLHMLYIIAKAYPSIITGAKMQTVSDIALHKDVITSKDFYTMKCAVLCLSTGPSYMLADSDMRAAYLHISPSLSDILLGAFCSDDEVSTRQWFALCEETAYTLFHIHPSPDKVLSTILKPMHASLSDNATATTATTAATASDDNTSTSSGKVLCSSSKLSRFLFLLGQCSLCTLIYAEEIQNLSKKAAAAKHDIDKTNKGKAGDVARGGGHADSMEEEMGMSAAADAESDQILTLLTEKHIVLDNLLGRFHQFIAYIVANDRGAYSNLLIRETSVLALCRYMSVSSIMCEMYLPLLFTILEKEVHDNIRTTIVIALGDLAFRYPNLLEPWNCYMYARLQDTSVIVRYNSLMVLTHLILNDMIKVKGQVSQVVCCLKDSHESIRDLATLFFNRLSERSNNPIYNLLGDIIASLSAAGDSTTSTTSATSATASTSSTTAAIVGNGNAKVLGNIEFQEVMRFLLDFIKRDKQADGLLERLILRIGMTSSLIQKRNLSFCIGELSITEKGVKRMVELMKHIKDALYDTVIFEYFKTTIAKAKKTCKGVGISKEGAAETKNAIDECELILENIRRDATGTAEDSDCQSSSDITTATASDDVTNDENSIPATATSSAGNKQSKLKAKTTVKKASKKKKARADSDGESDGNSDGDDDRYVEEVNVKKATATTARSRRQIIED